MKRMDHLNKSVAKLFITALVSGLFSIAASADDLGYVGEDETEISLTRNYSKQPTFPRKALRKGTEGYVIVEFDVDTDGAVLDPYVVESIPRGVFERASIKAIRSWVYHPPNHNGQSVKANNVQVKLTFAFQAQ